MSNFTLKSSLTPALVILRGKLCKDVPFFEIEFVILHSLEVIQGPDWDTCIFNGRWLNVPFIWS